MRFYFKIFIHLLVASFTTSIVLAQKRSNIWCFGHNAAINFNNSIPVPDSSSSVSRGSCATICDKQGNLLFYVVNDSNAFALQRGRVYQKNHQLMVNGDSIIGRAWYQEHIIITDPADTNSYYVFSCGVTSIYGFYYAKINMTLNNGFGEVMQKNIQLKPYRSADCIAAIKHGNGRDWWVIFRSTASLPNNTFYEYLVSPNGISDSIVFQAGSLNDAGIAKFAVSADNKKLAFVNAAGLIEIYFFNRCNGVIDSVRTIEPELSSAPYPWYWECAFSPNGNYLYVSTNDSSCLLLQYNLLDSNPALTRDTLWFINYPLAAIGSIRRAPDNKLYVSSAYYFNWTWNYPYPDSMYNVYNMNLSVINYPDSVGIACNFLPYSFYLGGKRTYWGLPNNPDYDLGPLYGSVCDSLSAGIDNPPAPKGGELFVTYVSAWQKLFVNAQNIKGKNAAVKIYDMNGRVVFSSSSSTHPPYFTQDVDVTSLSNGFYLISLVTEKEKLNAKFVKE